jgi:uncharacterized protein
VKIVIPGGSGQVGVMLARSLVGDGHAVVVLSRKPRPAPWRMISWDSQTMGSWADELDDADVVINLAGRSVNCRYSLANRRQIMDSRVQSTRLVGQAIARAARPPKLWLQASTATIYSHRYDAANDEYTGVLGGDEDRVPDTWRFSTDVAKAWEDAAYQSVGTGTRLVLMRAAMIMSADRDGVFDVLSGLVRKGLGGTNGDGKQYVSWIHESDFVRAVNWIIEHENLIGPINLASPNPLPNADFMAGLRNAWGCRSGLPASKWMLEVGTFLMRTESELVLKSRRVIPSKLLRSGLEFQFPDWERAAADLRSKY